MLASKLGSRYVGVTLLALMMLTLAPISINYAQDQEVKRAQKFIELAERAGEKVSELIDLIYLNETAIQTIYAADFGDELEANKTLFETGMEKLSNAQAALEADPPDYSAATGNGTEALSIFREVFKGLNTILEDSEVQKGELVDAQGLIEAMKRARDRIERLRGIASVEISSILDSAEAYLNMTQAMLWLSEGRVNETAHNMTQANKLISLAHSSLKKKAGELNDKRIQNYLKIIKKFYERIYGQVDKEVNRETLGAEELKDQLQNEVWPLIEEAESSSDAIDKLTEARNMLSEIEEGLKDLRRGGKQ